MKKFTLHLLIMTTVLLLSLPAYAWKSKIVNNQFKAADYIVKLQNGANPDKLQRPTLRRDEKAKAKAANRELRDAMDEAERLARAGKHDQIKPPTFRRIVSEEQYREIEKQR